MTKILVADDEGEVRKVIKLVLSARGYQVIEASDEEETYNAALKEKPDLILLDIMMPIMNGFDVLEKLKKDSDSSSIPVIMVTALDGPQDEQRGLKGGALDYITKPWAPGELEDRIRIAIPHLDEPAPTAPRKSSSDVDVFDLDSPPPPTLTSATSTKISTGSDPIDRALLGGIPLGSLSLVEGPGGTGKSVLSQHLVSGALMADQGVAFYVHGMTPEVVTEKMLGLGLDVSTHLKEGQLEIHQLEDFKDGGLEQLLEHLKELPWDMNVIVADSLTQLATQAESTDSLGFFMNCRSLCRMGKAILISLHSSGFDPEMLGRLQSLFATHLSLRVEGFTHGVVMKTMNVIDIAKVKDTLLKQTSSIFFEVDPELGRSMNMSLKVLPMFRVKT
jgi:archaellum biogenesis ATPase FlaH/DNA-binding NarL/FixJ family response regulator